MPQVTKERGQLLRRFRRSYDITLKDLADRTNLSQPTLTMFEQGTRNLSADAWARVLVELGKIEKEKSAERAAEFSKLQDEWTKAFFPALGELGGAFRLPAIEARQKQIVEQDSDSLELSQAIGVQRSRSIKEIDGLLAVEKSKALRQLKNPKFAKQLLEHYWALIEWRQKLLDLEAKGYAMRPKPKSIEEEIFELDAQGFAVIPKSMFEQLKARAAELEEELRAYKDLLPQSTRRIAELEQELARERANKVGDSPG